MRLCFKNFFTSLILFSFSIASFSQVVPFMGGQIFVQNLYFRGFRTEQNQEFSKSEIFISPLNAGLHLGMRVKLNSILEWDMRIKVGFADNIILFTNAQSSKEKYLSIHQRLISFPIGLTLKNKKIGRSQLKVSAGLEFQRSTSTQDSQTYEVASPAGLKRGRADFSFQQKHQFVCFPFARLSTNVKNKNNTDVLEVALDFSSSLFFTPYKMNENIIFPDKKFEFKRNMGFFNLGLVVGFYL